MSVAEGVQSLRYLLTDIIHPTHLLCRRPTSHRLAHLLIFAVLVCAAHCRYVQHPVPVKALGGERPDEPLKLYLTKKERKRIRRSAREEREQEKRDKMLMGLIPAPEPKFKLSNFMKILGRTDHNPLYARSSELSVSCVGRGLQGTRPCRTRRR